jgi:hypothetical protein
VEAFGFAGTGGNLYRLNNNKNQGNIGGVFNNFLPNYEAYLLKKFGGMVQAQYYFNNQWFVNAVYGVSKAFNVSRARSPFWQGNNGVNNMEWASNGDIPQTIQQINLTLWYRPIQAIKFGLQYSYAAATYFQYLNATNNPAPPAGFVGASNVNRSNFADNHRVEFVGFFYF